MHSSAPRTLLIALAVGVVGYLVGRSGPEEGTSVRSAPPEHVMEDPWDMDGRPAGEVDDREPDGMDDMPPGAASAGDDALPADLSELPAEVLGERALQEGEIVRLPQGDHIVRADGKGKLVLKKHGLWQEPLKRGKRREGTYHDGKRDGVWRWWYANGQLSHVGEWREGKAVGAHRIWHASGKLAETRQYENGSGNWIWWHSNGQKRSEGRMENGKRVGAWTAWHADGALAGEGSYVAGRPEGTHRHWHRNGRPTKVHPYKNGRPHGTWIDRYENGQKQKEGRYEKGKASGEWRYWQKNGHLRRKVTYRNGKRHGASTQYHPDGRVKWTDRYKNGKRVG